MHDLPLALSWLFRFLADRDTWIMLGGLWAMAALMPVPERYR